MAPERDAPAQLLIDLSVLVQKDDQSGIQRVVRSVLAVLQHTPPAGYRITPVYDAGGYYAYATRFGAAATEAADAGDIAPVQVRAGDIFFGLDLCPKQVPRNAAALADLRRHGVRLHFMVYDLLPINHPELFMAGAHAIYSEWLATVCQLADGLVCISRAVADDVLAWLEHHPVRRPGTLHVGYAHLGADLRMAQPTRGINAQDQAALDGIAGRPAILMVGTLEPRKAQDQALAAFELLWQRGIDASLVIVGKPGWMVDRLIERLRSHPELGRRLFWLEHASDEALLRLYRHSAALLAASQAEGFGLPLIEAAQHGLPVIARDIPVFREVGGSHAYYFDGETAGLASALTAWLDLHAQGRAPQSGGMPHLSWQQCTQQILACLLHQHWYRTAPTLLA